jgi:hypothetical protein
LLCFNRLSVFKLEAEINSTFWFCVDNFNGVVSSKPILFDLNWYHNLYKPLKAFVFGSVISFLNSRWLDILFLLYNRESVKLNDVSYLTFKIPSWFRSGYTTTFHKGELLEPGSGTTIPFDAMVYDHHPNLLRVFVETVPCLWELKCLKMSLCNK